MVAMVAEPLQSTTILSSEVPLDARQTPAPRFRYRLRFCKNDMLRLVSHHDLMNVLERMMRRASIPVAQTQGFHPQPRMVFALSLALGIAGANEVLELELIECMDSLVLQDKLQAQAPTGLRILSARLLEGPSAPVVRRAFYRLDLEGAEVPPEGLAARCSELLNQSQLWFERSRPKPRRLDIRPFLSELHMQGTQLEMAIWVTQTGSARPEEFARLLGLDHVLLSGAYFERTHLEMMDETAISKS
jgi:radical SAM-linked protein